MSERAQQVTYSTFRKRCMGLAEIERALGYDKHLSMKDDWAVSFHKSKIRSARVFYFDSQPNRARVRSQERSCFAQVKPRGRFRPSESENHLISPQTSDWLRCDGRSEQAAEYLERSC